MEKINVRNNHLKKGIITIVIIMLLLSIFLTNVEGINIKSHQEIISYNNIPEITDKSNDSESYLDIISVNFFEDQNEPEYIWTIMKLRNLKRRIHTYYTVSWIYNDTRYSSQTLFTISGVIFRYSYLKNGSRHYNSVDGEFDVINNLILVKIPKSGIGNPQIGDIFTHTAAFTMLEGLTKPIFLDYAPDCGYGKDYLIGGGNIDRNPGLQLIHCDFRVAFYSTKNIDSFSLSYFMPLNYDNQAPVFCTVRNDSTLKPKSFSIINDTNSPNKIIYFDFPALNVNESKYVHFDFLVFIKNKYYREFPCFIEIPEENEFPDTTRAWLASTKAIQTNNFLIKTTANKIRGSIDDLRELADKIVQFTMGRYSLFRSVNHPQDAISTLLTKGICVGTANLAAALFRANSIPSRSIYLLRTGGSGHAACEYYCPEYGWIPADSTFAQTPYEPKDAVVLRVNFPEDENAAGSFIWKNRGNEPTHWFSDDCIHLKFSSSNNGTFLKSDLVSEVNNCSNYFSQEALNITKKVWELFTLFFGQDLNNSEQEHFDKAVIFQDYAVDCFVNGNVSGYIENMILAFDEYMQIEF